MNKKCVAWYRAMVVTFVVLPVFGYPPISEAAEPVSLEALERMVERWVELRKAIADEKRAWDDEQVELKHLRQVLELEREQLNEDIDSLRATQGDLAEQRDDAAASLEVLEPLIKHWEELLTRAEQHVTRFHGMMPDSLTREHGDAWSTATAAGRVQRLQQVLYQFSLIENMQHDFHSSREALDIAGGQWVMDILYLGSSAAYAVNTDGSLAAVGRLDSGVWQWTVEPGIAREVRSAIRIHRREEPVRLVRLPLFVKGTEAP